MQRFDGKVVVVTGGGHGIGEATVQRFANEGARVAVVDIREPTVAIERLTSAGLDARPYQLDVADEVAVAGFGERVAGDLGPVDILVNNAGVMIPGTGLTLSLEDWRRTFSVNVDGMLLMARALLPGMIDRGDGAIVNVSSVGGLYGGGDLAAYSASKGAVVNLTRNLSTDFRRTGVRVNCVCPGWVDTGFNDPFIAGFDPGELQELMDRSVPAGRQSEPAEIAAVIAFLASSDASYVSGHALVVDGGMKARL